MQAFEQDGTLDLDYSGLARTRFRRERSEGVVGCRWSYADANGALE